MFLTVDYQIFIVALVVNGTYVPHNDAKSRMFNTGDKFTHVLCPVTNDYKFELEDQVYSLTPSEIQEYNRYKEYIEVMERGKDETLESFAIKFIENNFETIKEKCVDWGWEEALTLEGAIESLKNHITLSWVVAELASWDLFGDLIGKYQVDLDNGFNIIMGGVRYTWNHKEHELEKI